MGVAWMKHHLADWLLPRFCFRRPLLSGFLARSGTFLPCWRAQDVSQNALIAALGRAATINGKGTRLLVLIGTPARGVRGSGEYQQNLVAWLLEPTIANGLRLALKQFSPAWRVARDRPRV